jgi:hypothetical protein
MYKALGSIPAPKEEKEMSTSLIIRELQTETTMRYYYPPHRMSEFKRIMLNAEYGATGTFMQC